MGLVESPKGDVVGSLATLGATVTRWTPKGNACRAHPLRRNSRVASRAGVAPWRGSAAWQCSTCGSRHCCNGAGGNWIRTRTVLVTVPTSPRYVGIDGRRQCTQVDGARAGARDRADLLLSVPAFHQRCRVRSGRRVVASAAAVRADAAGHRDVRRPDFSETWGMVSRPPRGRTNSVGHGVFVPA